MKDTGIKRNLDNLGRIVIPIEMRRLLGMDSGAPIEFFIDREAGVAILQAYSMTRCVICGDDYGLTPVKGKYLCEDCLVTAVKKA